MFDAKKEKEKIIDFIRKYYKENDLGGAIIGISGGKDSGVVAGLFSEALGSENVVGVMLPCYSQEEDMNDALLVSDKYGFEMLEIDLNDVYDTFHRQIDNLGSFSPNELKNSDINLKPRLRMSSLYYLAPLMSEVKGKKYIVAGTSNKCEKYVGYFTKGGDEVSDINVLSELTVSEVIKLGEELEVPSKLLYKTPSDGLSGISDEEKLGVTYKEIERYLAGEEISNESREKINRLHNNSLHIFHIPTYQK